MRFIVLACVMILVMVTGGQASCTFQWDVVTKYVDGSTIAPGTVITYKLLNVQNDSTTRTVYIGTATTSVDTVCGLGEYFVVAVNGFGAESGKSNTMVNKQFSAVVNFRGLLSP